MHNCGHCMYHFAKVNIKALAISDTDKMEYWYCGHPNRRKPDKRYDEGTRCELFEDRYEDDRKVEKWIADVYRSMRKEKRHGRRRNTSRGVQ